MWSHWASSALFTCRDRPLRGYARKRAEALDTGLYQYQPILYLMLERDGKVAEMLERPASSSGSYSKARILSPSILKQGGGVPMTDSGKFAHYSPANIGYDVVWLQRGERARAACRLGSPPGGRFRR